MATESVNHGAVEASLRSRCHWLLLDKAQCISGHAMCGRCEGADAIADLSRRLQEALAVPTDSEIRQANRPGFARLDAMRFIIASRRKRLMRSGASDEQ